MREIFRGYYRPTPEEFDDLWTAADIVLDTNALLNLYRYTTQTQDEFLALLEDMRERLWLPFQVGLEFQRRRLDVIDQQTSAFADINGVLDSSESALERELNRFRRHPSLDSTQIKTAMTDSMTAVRTTIEQARTAHNAATTSGEDSVLAKITELYEGRVGGPLEAGELDQVYADGALRYEKKVPPGYKDQEKPEPDRYGDLVLWHQILKHAGESSKAAIFVTDDGKEDWWRIHKGRTIGPRPELVSEYFEAAHARVHFYSPEQFLKIAKERGGSTISDESVGEVQDVANAKSAARSVVLDHQQSLAMRARALERQIDRRMHRVEELSGYPSDPSSADMLRQQLENVARHLENSGRERELLENQIASQEMPPDRRESMLRDLGHAIGDQMNLREQLDSLNTRLRREQEGDPEVALREMHHARRRLQRVYDELQRTEDALAELDD